MSATMKAAIHLGLDHNANLFTYKNADLEELKTLFDITQKLILEQKHKIKQVSTIEWHVTPWVRSTVPHDRAIKLSKARGRCTHSHWSWTSGKNNSNISREPLNTKNFFGIDGEPFEFEWNMIPGHKFWFQKTGFSSGGQGALPCDPLMPPHHAAA